MKCWKFMECKPETYESCPAYPHKGLDCWKVTGTKCKGGTVETKTLEEKILICHKCDFYRNYAHKF